MKLLNWLADQLVDLSVHLLERQLKRLLVNRSAHQLKRWLLN